MPGFSQFGIAQLPYAMLPGVCHVFRNSPEFLLHLLQSWDLVALTTNKGPDL